VSYGNITGHGKTFLGVISSNKWNEFMQDISISYAAPANIVQSTKSEVTAKAARRRSSRRKIDTKYFAARGLLA
jgi:hypothetical protein